MLHASSSTLLLIHPLLLPSPSPTFVSSSAFSTNHAPQRPSAPTIFRPSSSFPFSIADIPSSHRPEGETIRLHLGNIPLQVSEVDVRSLLRYYNVEYSDISFLRHGTFLSAHFTVPSKAAYVAASSHLHGSTYHHHTLYLERNSPFPSPSHPIVVVRNLPLCGGVTLVNQLSRSTRTGAYGREMRW
jgi:hypothetical protein